MTKPKLDRAWERLLDLIIDRGLEVPDELVERFEEAPSTDLLLRHNAFRAVVVAIAQAANVEVNVGDEVSEEAGFTERKLKDRVNRVLVKAAEQIADQLEASGEPTTVGEPVTVGDEPPEPPGEQAETIEGTQAEQVDEHQKEPREEAEEEQPPPPEVRPQVLSRGKRESLEKHCIVWYSRLERHDPDRKPDLRVPNVTLDTFRALPDDQLVSINRELDERCKASKTAAHIYDREARALLGMLPGVESEHLTVEERVFKKQLLGMRKDRDRINAIRRMSRPDFDRLRDTCIAVLAGSAIDDLQEEPSRPRPPEARRREPEVKKVREEEKAMAENVEDLKNRVAALEESARKPRVDPQKVADLERQLRRLEEIVEAQDRALKQRVVEDDLTQKLADLKTDLLTLRTQVTSLVTADALNDAIDQRLQPLQEDIQALRLPAPTEPKTEVELPRRRRFDWITWKHIAAVVAALVIVGVLIGGGIVVWKKPTARPTVQIAPIATGEKSD